MADERSKKFKFLNDGRKYYVYRASDYNGLHYYGSRISKENNIIKDFWKYGTSSDRKQVILENSELYKVKIIKEFDNSDDMYIYESYLHRCFDVKDNDIFWNGANQTPFGFTTANVKRSKEVAYKTGSAMRGKHHSEETKKKIGLGGLGRKHSEETKNKIRDAHLGTEFTDEHRENIGKASKGRQANLGNSHSDETKKKIADARRATKGTYKLPIIKCPHCSKEGGSNNMKRWHFDNCKFK